MVKDILYITTFSSYKEIENLRIISGGHDPGYAIQKFSKLISDGFIHNGVKVHTLSSLPVNRSISKKLIWITNDSEEYNIKFHHIPFVNLPIIRQICLFLYSIFYVAKYCVGKHKHKIVLCDALVRSACMAALPICHMMGVKCVGLVTDMPGIGISNGNNHLISSLVKKINIFLIRQFDAYIFMTKYANEVLNKHKRPYIIMEGSVDISLKRITIKRKDQITKDIIYAGSLHARYGLRLLVEAFLKLPNDNIRLIIFGDGPFRNELQMYMDRDDRILYKGVVPNDEIVKAEQNAYLLINPRPIHEDFVYFSFPSKIHEYMVSGTAVATTKLPCISDDYDPYLFYLQCVSVEGFYQSLTELLSVKPDELKQKGSRAREFVLRRKNNVHQAERILELMNSLYN